MEKIVRKILMKSNLENNEIKDILNNAELIEFIVKKTSYKAFYKIMRLLHNPKDIIEMRKVLEVNVIENIDVVDDNKIKKEIISQIYFGSSVCDTLYNIETILERINSNTEFKEQVGEYNINLLRNIENLLLSDNQIDYKNIYLFNEYDDIANKLDCLFKLTKESFFEEVKNSVNNGDITKNINPVLIRAKNGKMVNFYTLQGQTDYQKKICILTRTMNVQNYMKKEGAMDEYKRQMQLRKYLSYSLNNEEIYNGYASKGRVTFGYKHILNNSLMSANTRDGQTNQYTLEDDEYIMRQQYMDLDLFFKNTDKYNELVIKNETILLPDYIVCNDYPTDEIIDIASNIGIDIIYMSPTYYKQHMENEDYNDKVYNQWYSNPDLLEYDFGLIAQNSIKQI